MLFLYYKNDNVKVYNFFPNNKKKTFQQPGFEAVKFEGMCSKNDVGWFVEVIPISSNSWRWSCKHKILVLLASFLDGILILNRYFSRLPAKQWDASGDGGHSGHSEAAENGSAGPAAALGPI